MKKSIAHNFPIEQDVVTGDKRMDVEKSMDGETGDDASGATVEQAQPLLAQAESGIRLLA